MTDGSSEAFPVLLRASACCRPQSVRREFLYRCLAPTRAQRGGVECSYAACTVLPIAQMKPASSRAIAVTATVSFFPRPAKAR